MTWLRAAERAVDYLRAHGHKGPFIVVRETVWFIGCVLPDGRPAVNDNEVQTCP